MNREVHVRFWEGLGVRFPRATQLAAVFRLLAARRKASTARSAETAANTTARSGWRQRGLEAKREYSQLHSLQAKLLEDRTQSKQ
jgi:hypothetical protein